VNTSKDYDLVITDLGKTSNNFTRKLAAGKTETIVLDLASAHHWYDFKVQVKGLPDFEQHYAGRVEKRGSEGFSDPVMGTCVRLRKLSIQCRSYPAAFFISHFQSIIYFSSSHRDVSWVDPKYEQTHRSVGNVSWVKANHQTFLRDDDPIYHHLSTHQMSRWDTSEVDSLTSHLP